MTERDAPDAKDAVDDAAVGVRYWALVRGSKRKRKLIGYIADFYPNEAITHYAAYRQQGHTIIGTYDNPEQAMAAVERFMAAKCHELSSAP
jgi:hypothetical protein